MGVHGLWKLLEPSGQMVPLESLAGKVLAVDVSIWLHQAIKGMHDTYGAPVGAAHLIILFHRLCKLLFYKIKPVFVFDGGVPTLKHQTMAARRTQSSVAKSEAMKVREKLIKNLLKHEAIRQVLANETASAALGLNSFALPGPSVEEDLYKLPPVAADCEESASTDEGESDTEENDKSFDDIHSVDVTSKEFVSLPPEMRHDILIELIETRKQSSWKHLDNMPKNSDNFSDFQMNRLLKRHAVQTSLEKAGKEMGGRALSIKELESILGDKGVLNVGEEISSKRIAQDNVTRYMLLQKNSGSDSDLLKKEEVGEVAEKFDIMDHLDDVEWSSESDTDVILEKSPKRRKKIRELLLGKNNQSTDERLTEEKKPKVHVTKEIADILTVLEDDNVDGDIKIKIQVLQNRLNLTANDLPIKHETDSLECEDIPKIENDLLGSPPKQVRTERGRTAAMEPSAAPTDESVPRKEVTIDGTSEVPAVHENLPVKEEEEKKETDNLEEELTQKDTADLPAEVEGESKEQSSSSDSESDFIPIEFTDPETISLSEKKVIQKSPSIRDVSNEECNQHYQSCCITVIPSKISEADDLFADVFEKSIEPVSPGKKKIHDENIKNDEEEAEGSAVEDALQSKKQMTAEEISNLKRSLEEDRVDLVMEKGRQERLALNPTDQMYSDAQELLRLFGIPYVVAPMEAEAQCAVLNSLGLTEGTITDDSDIWLFGGRVVYKNFFNQNKHVLEYTSANIQKYFKLNREDLIRMAMLVGSDYTVGLNGIGPVTALEILASFPSQGLFEGLEKFRDWFTGRCKSGAARTSLKKKIRKTVITPGFPNKAVAEAYLHPIVIDSKEPFSWAKPNLELIRKYVKMKIGWSSDKCNDLLLPVIKKLEENMTQNTMEKYFKIETKADSSSVMLSKRVENAVKQLGREDSEAETGIRLEDIKRKKRKPCKKKITQSAENQVKEGDEKVEKAVKKRKVTACKGSTNLASIDNNQKSKEKIINEKLYREEKIPQKERTQKLLEVRKKQAIEIFRTYKGKGKKRTKVYAKKEANLSESSSEGD